MAVIASMAVFSYNGNKAAKEYEACLFLSDHSSDGTSHFNDLLKHL